MSWSRWASFCLVSLAACHRVQVVGESTRLRSGDAVPRSAIFDGERVELRAARGETLGVQVLGAPSAKLSLPVAEISPFGVGRLTVHQRSTSMYGPSTGRGEYPDILYPNAAEPTYFDVAVPPRTPPGRYPGSLAAGEKTYPVTLTVEPVTLDLQPFVWVFYLPGELARAHKVADDDGPAEIALEKKYDALFRAHGAYLASDVRPARFLPRRELARGVKYWPVAVDISDDGQLTDDVHAWLRLMQDLPLTPFAIPIDEPHGHEARLKLRHVFEVMGQAGGSAPRLLRAVTAHPSPELEGVTDVYFDGRDGGWTYNGRPPQSGALILDTSGTALRTWGWVAWRRKYTLWYAWEGLYFSDRYNHRGPTDVLHDPLTFQQQPPDDDRGNGDGILAYPGPLPSLRLKALRRGLLDRLLLQKLESCGGEARPFYDSLFDKDGWVAGEAAWEEARGRILDELVKRCPDAS